MPQPTSSDVHVDAILSQISVAYMQSQDAYIANRVFPTVSVAKQSDKYFVYTKGDWFRDEAQLRAPATPSAGSGYGLSTATYNADVYAMHKDVDDQTRANADDPLNPDRDATQFVTQRMLMKQEVDWSSSFFTTGVWDTDVVGGTNFTQWSNYTSSDPIEDIETGKATMLNSTGFLPNTLVLSYDAMRQLRNHPDIVDRIKYTSANTPTEATLASLFGVDRVMTAVRSRTRALRVRRIHWAQSTARTLPCTTSLRTPVSYPSAATSSLGTVCRTARTRSVSPASA